MTFVLNIYKQNLNRSVKKIIMSKEESKDERKTNNSDKPTKTEIESEPNIEEPMSDNIKDLNFLLGINPNYLD